MKEKDVRLKQIIQQLENEKSTNETLLSELANSTAEIKTLKDSFREKEISLNAQVNTYKLTDTKSTYFMMTFGSELRTYLLVFRYSR